MITIDKTYQDKLVEYFSKGIYNTNEILKEAQYSSIYLNVKDFLENLTFEENGILKEDVLFSENSNNKKIIEDFFTRLTNRFGPNSRDIFIDTQKINGSIQCDYSSLDNDEQVKCIKKFILEKYENMYTNMRNIHGKELIKSSDISICPYCYRSYIGVIEEEKGKRAITPDLDHFYPKSKYPFLAVTLSNLIPSCLFCNQRAKKAIDFYKTSIYPPNKIFDDIKFDFDPYSGKIFIENYYDLISKIEYKIHLDTFLIQEVYASHREILDNLLSKVTKYRSSKIDDIAEYTAGLTSSEIKKIIFYEYEFMNNKKELLYKSKKDLYEKIVKL
ncbi:HNH endonuclease [Aliarcobacter butzleri]|uniref:HNH domain-containing protein n=1 Tax=Aliarcobacter butzleri L352 TaxID=1447260 RepID=A0A837JE85_9BACT|nr:hypothetical protein [Aliarcobacter butzleri]KLE06378.1 hypothetical protein AF77_02020 [Aliarcobacter butzleri L352]